ncbi:MAG: toprim domain-containing protein [Chitinophagaceae bacterium]|nr:toprim domain-containing protein [Chitinophagaceae bacterium]MCA6455486.1 toprim domain-containing protein [Chitinophagaceae bacterium]MCA6460573.1 toprim domain-containing protein [Chitinophagaceae bacterium]MCA6464081.1 toprim domain-containing protein [Chitinophagaceae bacterium]
MNCEQANQLELVSVLASLGHSPVKTRRNDHWYHSPLHPDNTPSFKVNSAKNTWYDFGLGKGGTVVDLVCTLYHCDITTALAKIGSLSTNPDLSFPRQKKLPDQDENGIIIQSVKERITASALLSYLQSRHISPSIAAKYCHEVLYQVRDCTYRAIGFKNNSGGYELRSPGFKGSTSPKFVTYLNRESNRIAVFEGFFDFLSYETLAQKRGLKQEAPTPNILVLNSLSFFTRSLLLMEKHQQIHLYLDNDTAGQKCIKELQQRTDRVMDERSLYKGCKDLNEWLVDQGRNLGQRKGLRP